MRCSRLRPAPEETPPSLWHTVCVSASPPMSMHKQTLQICSEGAPGRPRGALAASQVSFTGCPFHSSCPSCEQNPWPGAHLGLVGSLWVAAGWSWQFEPGTPRPHTHTHTAPAASEASARPLPTHVSRIPEETRGGMQKQLFLLII